MIIRGRLADIIVAMPWRMNVHTVRSLILCYLVLIGCGQTQASDKYFVTIFAAETVPFEPRKTHTFVVVHHVANDRILEQHHISWFPQSRTLRGVTLLPEAGVNLTIEDTFAHCREYNMQVAVWGPYEIMPELYGRIRDQRRKLESGVIRYKPTDTLYPSCIAANCYHAIWQPIAPWRKFSGAFNCGHASGATTVALFSRWIVEHAHTYDVVLQVMVPPEQPIQRRDFHDRPRRIDALRSFMLR